MAQAAPRLTRQIAELIRDNTQGNSPRPEPLGTVGLTLEIRQRGNQDAGLGNSTARLQFFYDAVGVCRISTRAL